MVEISFHIDIYLQHFCAPQGSFFQEVMSDVFGQGIFVADGAKWKSTRQVTARIMNAHNFRVRTQKWLFTSLVGVLCLTVAKLVLHIDNCHTSDASHPTSFQRSIRSESNWRFNCGARWLFSSLHPRGFHPNDVNHTLIFLVPLSPHSDVVFLWISTDQYISIKTVLDAG